MIMKVKYVIPAVILSIGIYSCGVTKKYESPEMHTDSLYRDVEQGDTTNIANLPWHSLFSDVKLQALIEEGLEKNLDLRTAIQVIYEADAILRQSKAAMLPSLDANIQVNRSRQSQAALNFPPDIDINLNTTTYLASLSSSWEADVWGKLRSSKRAAFASLLQSDASRRAIQTQLVADIALNYYSLLALDQQLAITQRTLENRKKDVETMKALKEAATVTGAAVVQSEANRYAAEVLIPDIKRNIRETENALCILLARTPGKIERSDLLSQKNVNNLQVGVPSQLLKNRPDVQQAEFAFRAAFENTNVARAYFYPALTLTAEGGISSLLIENLFKQSVFYSLIGGLTQPIFAQGANKARLRTAQAQQLQAFYSFEQSLLAAGQEVSNALYSYDTAIEKQQSRKKQLDALNKAVEFTKALLQFSAETNYTDVLTSEQNLLSAELDSINDRLQEFQAVINLYRALGGGVD